MYLMMAYLLVFILSLTPGAVAQVITSIPAQPTIEDSIVVIFDASEGDKGLRGFPGDVYAHTGVLTEQSTNPTDWKYVIGTWGDNSIQPKLTNFGADLWRLTIGDIRQFYGVPASETVTDLAFVFRSANTQRTGRDTGGGDIFLNIFEVGLTVFFIKPDVRVLFGSPARSPHFMNPDDTLRVIATSAAIESEIGELQLQINQEPVISVSSDTLLFDFLSEQYGPGLQTLTLIASDSTGPVDSASVAIMINPPVNELPRPIDAADGINSASDNSVTVSLFAPHKDFVYLIGDFNDWKIDPDFLMNRDTIRPDSAHYWLTLQGMDPDVEYAFQYFVDGDVRIADPYSELILTPNDDRFISAETFPNLKSYPEGKTSDNVSTFKINRTEYVWEVEDFQRPDKTKLVIYELLIRDFIAAHNYATMIDTLNYLENLGINAIELMPVNEFEGNESWGYNPAFYFAPDKYYGTPEALKKFIDECHKRGIAVILDAVLNHSFGQHSLVRLYAAGHFGPPTPENPWYNVTARHPFNVGWDFDHESANTKAFVDRVNAFWLIEFKVDGFRFDLSKGFTQRNTANNVGAWGQFDPSRVALLTRMADRIWQVDSTAYVILEHFADNEEEKILADRGMMLWGNLNSAYSQSAMGWLEDDAVSSDLSWGFYKTRGWSKPHLVTYMESHDEPWLMYKNREFGRSSPDGSYSTQDLKTGLDRIKLAALFFLTLPGPKMIWQFGELGYDQHLAESGFERTSPKPILWDYFADDERRLLYEFYSELLKLRREYEVFSSTQTTVSMRVGQGQYDRRLTLSHPSVNIVVIGNFDVVARKINPNFFHGGLWYEYFFADSINVTSSFDGVQLKPGGFRMYSDKNIGFAKEILVTSVSNSDPGAPERFHLFQNYPNPFNPETIIEFELSEADWVELHIYNLRGQRVRTLFEGKKTAGHHTQEWNGRSNSGKEMASGIYIVRLAASNWTRHIKVVKVK